MQRRNFIKSVSLGAAVAGAGNLSVLADGKKRRPNFLIITLEDVSQHLGCYGAKGAKTPVLDKLAAEGTRFTNMFASAPVCAPARCSLITGVYATSLGAQHMRTLVRRPKEIPCYTEYLRKAGYYCTNNRKTDYQFMAPKGAWDECGDGAHWKNRKNPDQPFYHITNFISTHQGSVVNGYRRFGAKLSPEQRVDRSQLHMPAWLPETPLMRKYLGNTYDNLAWIGQQIGKMLNELEETGLADDTIVIFYTDHGDGAMPRSKEYLYDSGTLVPFIMRGAKNFPVAGIDKPGAVNERLCNFVDLPPTVLSILGMPVPEYMQGRVFLGDNIAGEHEYLVATRDRANTRYDTHRSVRDKRFLYIRYLRPYLPHHVKIRGFESPGMRELRSEFAKGNLSPEAAQFFGKTKPAEELYDTFNDPDNVHNLAADPKYAGLLKTMRARLLKWQKETCDTGMIPEGMLHQFRDKTGSEWAVGHGVKGLYDPETAFNWMTLGHLEKGFDQAAYLKGLRSDDPVAQYWCAVNTGYFFEGDFDRRAFVKALTPLLKSEYGDVTVGAAFALLRLGAKKGAAHAVLRAVLADGHMWVRLNALNLIDDLELETLEAVEPEMMVCTKFKCGVMAPPRYVRELAQDLLTAAGKKWK